MSTDENIFRSVRHVVVILTMLLLIPTPSFSACPAEEWGWDNDEQKTCVPCDHTRALSASQKYPSFCTTSTGSANVGARVYWEHDYSGSVTYSVTISVNGTWADSLTVTTKSLVFAFADYNIFAGDQICVTVKAYVDGDEAESAPTCKDNPVIGNTTVYSDDMTLPTNITIEFE